MSVARLSGKGRCKALALIVVVYVLAALGTFAFALAFRSKVGLCQAQLLTDRVQQDQTAWAACAQACRLLALDDPNVDSHDDTWSGWHALEMPQDSMDGEFAGQVWWRLVDESARINVNLAPSDVLSRIEGLDQAAVASILDWIDEDDIPNPDGAEKEYYASLSAGYACRNGPLEGLEELAFVKGITAERYFGTRQLEPLEDGSGLALEQVDTMKEEEGSAGLSEVLTVYGDGRINLNTALPDVLKAIPFLSAAAIDEVLSRQQPRVKKFTSLEDIEANDAFSELDKIVLMQVARFNSSVFQLQVRVKPEGMPVAYEYGAFLERDGPVVRVVSWQRKLARKRSGSLHQVEGAGRRVQFMD